MHIYDQSLKLQLSKEIADVIPQNFDIQMLKLRNNYVVFAHVPKSDKYQLWKVDARGNATNILSLFFELKANFKDTNAVVHLT